MSHPRRCALCAKPVSLSQGFQVETALPSLGGGELPPAHPRVGDLLCPDDAAYFLSPAQHERAERKRGLGVRVRAGLRDSGGTVLLVLYWQSGTTPMAQGVGSSGLAMPLGSAIPPLLA